MHFMALKMQNLMQNLQSLGLRDPSCRLFKWKVPLKMCLWRRMFISSALKSSEVSFNVVINAWRPLTPNTFLDVSQFHLKSNRSLLLALCLISSVGGLATRPNPGTSPAMGHWKSPAECWFLGLNGWVTTERGTKNFRQNMIQLNRTWHSASGRCLSKLLSRGVRLPLIDLPEGFNLPRSGFPGKPAQRVRKWLHKWANLIAAWL